MSSIDPVAVARLAREGFSIRDLAKALEVSESALVYALFQGKTQAAKAIRAAYDAGRRLYQARRFDRDLALELLKAGYSAGAVAVRLNLPMHTTRYHIGLDPELQAAFEANRGRADRVSARKLRSDPAEETWAVITGFEAAELQATPPAPSNGREGPFTLFELLDRKPLDPDERRIREALIFVVSPGSMLSKILEAGPRTLPGIMRLSGWEQREAECYIERAIRNGSVIRTRPAGGGLCTYKKNPGVGGP